MSGHNIGPWVYHADRENGEHVFRLYDGHGQELNVLAYYEPDARLIASAPDMLTALRDAVESLERLPDVRGAYRVTVLQQARAAIAKATGHGE